MLQRVDLGWVHYLVFARAALTKEIRQGSLIYLGGNRPALLKDFPNVLNVAVVADMDYRIDRLLRRTDYVINRKKARQIIEVWTKRKPGGGKPSILVTPGRTAWTVCWNPVWLSSKGWYRLPKPNLWKPSTS